MAQTTANPGGTYTLGSGRRAMAAVLATVAAFSLVALLMAGPEGDALAGGEGVAAVSSVAAFPQVDDFVTRRYLSTPTPADDTWKDDHITRRYLPGS